MALLHSMIRVKDVEKSIDFYTKLFDMRLESKRRLDDCWLYFLTDKDTGVQIELTYNDDTPKEGYNIGNGFGHFAFSVKSLEEFTKKLKEYNWEYLYEPFDVSGKGSLIAFIKDPDGYEIELLEKVLW